MTMGQVNEHELGPTKETWREQVGNVAVAFPIGMLALYGVIVLSRLAGYRFSGLSLIVIPPTVLLAAPLRRRFQAGVLWVRLAVAAGWLLIVAAAVLGPRLLPPNLR